MIAPAPSPTFLSYNRAMSVEDLVAEDRRGFLRAQNIRRARNPIKGHHRKVAMQCLQTIERLVAVNPKNHFSEFTLTCRPGTSPKRAATMFRNLNPILQSVFPGGFIRVISPTAANIPHVHVIGIASGDVLSGFNLGSYERARELKEKGSAVTPEERLELRQQRKLVSSNSLLHALQEQLLPAVAAAGFGWHFQLLPIYKEVVHAALYLLIGNYYAAIRNPVWRNCRPRLMDHSRGKDFPWVRAKDLPRSQGSIEFEQKRDRVAAALDVDPDDLQETFGRHINFRLFTVFDELAAISPRYDPVSWKEKDIRRVACQILGWRPDWL